MKLSMREILAIALLSSLVATGCQNWGSGDIVRPPLVAPDAGVAKDADAASWAPPDLASMPGVGDSCSVDLSPCREGLSCIEGTCRAIGTSTPGTTCILSDECTDGLVCGLEGRCVEEGSALPGELCVRPDGCAKGSVCASAGFYGTCVASGTGDLGDSCEVTQECLSGLFCSESRV